LFISFLLVYLPLALISFQFSIYSFTAVGHLVGVGVYLMSTSGTPEKTNKLFQYLSLHVILIESCHEEYGHVLLI